MYENKFYELNKKDVYSQNGEDGVIAAIAKILEVRKGWVCEFGAWDGQHLSNTFALVEQGFKAVFIEANPVKFGNLMNTCKKFPNIIPIQNEVSYKRGSQFCLDRILARTDIEERFFLLSIDIDGFDYHVWKIFQHYKPRVVIIEINSAVEPTVTDWIHSSTKEGTGFHPMLQLGLQKGYQLLCHTGNMVFVCNEDASKFTISPEPLTCFRRNWIEAAAAAKKK